jgi:hypothetical protein
MRGVQRRKMLKILGTGDRGQAGRTDFDRSLQVLVDHLERGSARAEQAARGRERLRNRTTFGAARIDRFDGPRIEIMVRHQLPKKYR